jgi:hypothetical protein
VPSRLRTTSSLGPGRGRRPGARLGALVVVGLDRLVGLVELLELVAGRLDRRLALARREPDPDAAGDQDQHAGGDPPDRRAAALVSRLERGPARQRLLAEGHTLEARRLRDRGVAARAARVADRDRDAATGAGHLGRDRRAQRGWHGVGHRLQDTAGPRQGTSL